MSHSASPPPAIFLFGTLLDDDLRAVVLGAMPAPLRPARLPGHAVRTLPGTRLPVLVPAPGEVAEGGLLVAPDAEAVARLDFYEAVWGYVRREATVKTDRGPVPAHLYCPVAGDMPATAAKAREPWSLSEWQAAEGGLSAEAAREEMALFPARSPEEIAAMQGPILARARSRLAARDHSPVRLRRGLDESDVETRDRTILYSGFFNLEERRLRHRLFDGGTSDVITRLGFVMTDAVTVLPWDPWQDRVLLVEQFRAGPWLRGDPVPWTLEPIAGRRDADESIAEAARREAREEAGLDLQALEKVAQYYVSPGAVTEYLFSFVGIAKLPEGKDRIAGLAAEHEDIRAFTLPFAELLQAIETGEAENGPLLVTALWLANNHDRLVEKYARSR